VLLFDIGANRGDAVLAGLQKGYDVIAVEPAPRVFAQLVKNFIYNPRVTPVRYAISDKDYDYIEFYECVEDGLSTTNLDWLTKEGMPYAGKPYRTTKVTTITIDTLADKFGVPDLIKIDVEGGEWSVLRGMKRKYSKLAMEWTFELLNEHDKQCDYLYKLGYREVAPQYIVPHLEEPSEWFELLPNNKDQMLIWHQSTSDEWIDGGWQVAGLRPTADVGMLWFR
jgi:FkbM family methyltransferase